MICALICGHFSFRQVAVGLLLVVVEFPNSSRAPCQLPLSLWLKDDSLLADCTLGFGDFSALILSYFDFFSFSLQVTLRASCVQGLFSLLCFFSDLERPYLEASCCAAATVLSSPEGG